MRINLNHAAALRAFPAFPPFREIDPLSRALDFKMRHRWRCSYAPGALVCSSRSALLPVPPRALSLARPLRRAAQDSKIVAAEYMYVRPLHSSPATRARGSQPPPRGSPPPTSFSDLDVLGGTPAPATSVDVCTHDGFGLNSGVTISGGDGTLLVNGRAFAWRPWEMLDADAGKDSQGKRGAMSVMNTKGQFELPKEAFGLFDLLWPRPEMLVVGVGKHNMPLSPETRRHIAELGMRVEILDTRNAAAQFNLLATERGVSEVAAALIPLGWVDGRFEE